jgi:hypothetical protein
MYTDDVRFCSINNDNDDWSLLIIDVKQRDARLYQCVSSTPFLGERKVEKVRKQNLKAIEKLKINFASQNITLVVLQNAAQASTKKKPETSLLETAYCTLANFLVFSSIYC